MDKGFQATSGSRMRKPFFSPKDHLGYFNCHLRRHLIINLKISLHRILSALYGRLGRARLNDFSGVIQPKDWTRPTLVPHNGHGRGGGSSRSFKGNQSCHPRACPVLGSDPLHLQCGGLARSTQDLPPWEQHTGGRTDVTRALCNGQAAESQFALNRFSTPGAL